MQQLHYTLVDCKTWNMEWNGTWNGMWNGTWNGTWNRMAGDLPRIRTYTVADLEGVPWVPWNPPFCRQLSEDQPAHGTVFPRKTSMT